MRCEAIWFALKGLHPLRRCSDEALAGDRYCLKHTPDRERFDVLRDLVRNDWEERQEALAAVGAKLRAQRLAEGGSEDAEVGAARTSVSARAMKHSAIREYAKRLGLEPRPTRPSRIERRLGLPPKD